MSKDARFVQNTSDLIESVRSFMAAPEYWRVAVGGSPKYFVHYEECGQHHFGLSKFSAFKDIRLVDYVVGLRHTTKGDITQRHISKVSSQAWVPLYEVDASLRDKFVEWFTSFFPQTYDMTQVSIISLGSSSASRPKVRSASSHTRRMSPKELEHRLKRQNEIGLVGEMIALRYEVERLKSLGVKEPEKYVDHVARRNVAAGFDILSHPYNLPQRFVEVKSSVEEAGFFFITENEISVLEKHGKDAYVYLVHILDVEQEQGSVISEISHPIQALRSRGSLQPVLYRARIEEA